MKKRWIYRIFFILFLWVPLIIVAASGDATPIISASIFEKTQNFKTKIKGDSVYNVNKTLKSFNDNKSQVHRPRMFLEDSRGNLWAICDQNDLKKYDYNDNTWNIDIEYGGTFQFDNSIFSEDSRGNLWLALNEGPLQKYNYNTKVWIKDKTSNITDGWKGFMFEDSRGNLWAAGNKTSLQKYDYSANAWTDDTTSIITNGHGGFMFEDSHGNLWVVSNNSTLEKYDYNKQEWKIQTFSLYNGFMFEDSRGNIWAMEDDGLLKYDYNDNTWNYSNDDIEFTGDGFMFEDSRGNLWAAGDETSLQKYNYNTNEWTSDSESNITNGKYGFMFEDSQGNLWAMGNKTRLQKYNYDDETWENDNSSGITNGKLGIMFEDSHGNLWAGAWGLGLEKYDYATSKWHSYSKKYKSIWKEESSTSKNNITDGNNGFIFEDSRGNLWAAGNNTPLQKYNYGNKTWVADISSNIKDGYGGFMFEDSRGNLWAASNNTPLQKYNYYAKTWIIDISSNIENGEGGFMFEDSYRNLWAAGYGTSLQKYDYSKSTWIDIKSNIKDGEGGFMFEDSHENLWAAGYRTSLQKYNYEDKTWVADISSNIKDGEGGFMFEDSRGNLWAAGNGTQIQKYNYKTKKWKDDNSKFVEYTHDAIKTRNKKTNGRGGVMFEDAYYNFWMTTYNKGLYKYKGEKYGWTLDNTNNIKDGSYGTIFEDSQCNLWSMGKKTKLKKYDHYNDSPIDNYKSRWQYVRHSNIVDGSYGTIFEDSHGNLWAMSRGTSLQKLSLTKTSYSIKPQAKFFKIRYKSKINENSKLALSIIGFKKYASNKYTHLKYKRKDESNWKIVKNKLMILEPAEYQFKWVLGTAEVLGDLSEIPPVIEIKADGSIIEIEKEIISSTNLITESFKVSLDVYSGQGTIQIKDDINLPEEVETRFWIDRGNKIKTASTNDDEYYLEKPQNLENGDVVYIKFFIKENKEATHRFLKIFNNSIAMPKISGLIKNNVPTKDLKAESFELSSKVSDGVKAISGYGTIKLKSKIKLPKQVKVKFLINKPGRREYNEQPPRNLTDGDEVWIKFFIKNDYVNTHTFPTRFQSLIVMSQVELLTPENEIDTTDLISDSFEISNEISGSGTIIHKTSIKVPEQIRLSYKVNKNTINELDLDDATDYDTNKPINLANGDVVLIKFFIRKIYRKSHKFPKTFINLIEIPVTGLTKKDVSITNLNADSFEIPNGISGSGTIQPKSRDILPAQVEARYWVDNNGREGKASNVDANYQKIQPINLVNGDVVYIKFFIKNAKRITHQFPIAFNTNPISLSVSELLPPKTEVGIANLNANSFEIPNEISGSGTIQPKSSGILPAQVEARYWVDNNGREGMASSVDANYQKIQPINLVNGDEVYIKFFIKDEYKDSHKFPKKFVNLIKIIISSLIKKDVSITNLNANSFEIPNGISESGTIQPKSSRILPAQVEARYWVDNNEREGIASSADANYQKIRPTNLVNGDVVYIKFFIKNIKKTTHQFPTTFNTNPVALSVSELLPPKIEVDIANLNASSFEIPNGINRSGTIQPKSSGILPAQVEARYWVDKNGREGMASSVDANYQKIRPINLVNSDEVYIKFFIKDEYKDSHKFPTAFNTNPISLSVSELLPPKTEVGIANLNANSFEIPNEISGSGTIQPKSGKILPTQVEAHYWVDNNGREGMASSVDANYQKIRPTNLVNGDVVYIKFFIKDEYKDSHKFPIAFNTNPVSLQVDNLKTNTPILDQKKQKLIINDDESKSIIFAIISGTVFGISILGYFVYHIAKSRQKYHWL